MIFVAVRTLTLPSGEVAVLDEADWERTFRVEFTDEHAIEARPADFSWHARKSNRTSYVQTNCTESGRPGGGRTLSLHRLIFGAKANELVDHENCNGLDCRRSNLRAGDKSKNAANRRPFADRALPKGVSVHKATGRLQVVVGHKRKRVWVGLFDDPALAAT